MTYLLDINTCIEYLRQKNSRVIQRIQAVAVTDIHLCSVVKAELFAGAFASRRIQINLAKVTAFAQPYLSLPFDDAAAMIFGQVRADLAARGLPIGPYDMMIAAIAVANHLTLVTHNTAEFSRVNGLLLDDWQA